MNILRRDKPYKPEYSLCHDGVTVKIKIKKLDSVGSPRGSISIKGNGMNLEEKYSDDYGLASTPMRLDVYSGRSNVVRLGHKLMEKYQCQVDFGNLHTMFAPLFNKLNDDFNPEHDGLRRKKY